MRCEDPTSLKEYLKKYTSNDDKEKKKKKKRKAKPDAAGVRVVDEDPILQRPLKHDEEKEEESAGRFRFMKRLEQLRSKLPFGVISEDGSGWISVSNVPNNMKSENQSLDISPPRKRRPRNDTPSPEPQQRSSSPAGSDLSPPRQSRKHYQSFPGGRGARYDTPSPERPVKDAAADVVTDLSPPRRRQRDKHASSPEPRRISLHSKAATDSDNSPPRRARFDSKDQNDSSAADLSPPRKSKNDTADPAPSVSDLSPPRRRKESSVSSYRPKSGLVSREDVKDEIDKKRKEDLLRFKEMDPSVSGRDAEATYHNKLTGERMSKEDFLKSREKELKKEEKPKEVKLEWGKGLAQKREVEARLQEMEAEKDKPFARSRDDPELDALLKERVRWGDPMAHLVKKKHLEPVLPDLGDSERMKESGFIIPQEIPTHSWIRRGLDAAPNRYGIKPGRHWDGVDRSNGNEKELFKRMNEKRATETEAYLWSVSDM